MDLSRVEGHVACHQHSCIGAVGFIAFAFGHSYIGSIGMEGALEAMTTGQVDEAWAKEHHDLWFEEVTGRSAGDPDPTSTDYARESATAKS